jgi:hypothetical protein
MTETHEKPEGPFDWMFSSAIDWGWLFMVAQELRHADDECLDALIEAQTRGSAPLSPDDAVRARSLARMLKSLDLDADAIHRLQPDLMPALERACIGCTERSRCDRELAQGTTAENRAEFCPNTSRLNALLGITAAAG